jgi:8-oxo-dGTP pyrophosphatase MutT (NUDIX family)
METNPFLHEVAITAIIIKDGKYLVTRRSPNKKRFPGMWTVPGGRLEAKDYTALHKDTEAYWYNVLERALVREVKEESGVDIKNVEYLTSLATVHQDGSPSIVISCIADYAGGEVTLQLEECDEYRWVSTEESKSLPLIDGIYEEFVQIDEWKKTGVKPLWQKVAK